VRYNAFPTGGRRPRSVLYSVLPGDVPFALLLFSLFLLRLHVRLLFAALAVSHYAPSFRRVLEHDLHHVRRRESPARLFPRLTLSCHLVIVSLQNSHSSSFSSRSSEMPLFKPDVSPQSSQECPSFSSTCNTSMFLRHHPPLRRRLGRGNHQSAHEEDSAYPSFR
jgi:hypothetical protein